MPSLRVPRAGDFFLMLAASICDFALICSAESVPKSISAQDRWGAPFEVKRHCFCPGPARRAKVMMFGQMPSVITAGNMFLEIAAAAEYYSSSPSRRGNCDGKCRLLVIAFAVSI
jgi:hypothetical protein